MFESQVFGGRELSLEDPSGALLDVVIGIVLGETPYLHPADAARRATLLVDLKSFVVPDHPRLRRGGPVNALPLRDLPGAARRWIDSKRRSSQPLMSSFAIDVVEVLRLHLQKQSFFQNARGKVARVSPLLVLDDERPFSFLDEPQFKKEITGAIRDLCVIVEIPSNGNIKIRDSDHSLSEGALFVFEVQRCHMSSGTMDAVQLDAVDGNEPEFDAGNGFRFRGGLRLVLPSGATIPEDGSVFPYEIREESHPPMLEVPARWIKACLEQVDYRSPCVVRSMPRWEVR